jgi:hypothetical protein
MRLRGRSPRAQGISKLLALVVAALFLGGSLTPLASAHASTIQIASSGTSKGVNPTTYQPIDSTQNFSTGDAAIYSWVEFVNVYSPSHNVTWVWLTPQRHVYATSNATISDPGKGNYLPSAFYYAQINVTGTKAAQLPGSWQVEVYVDGAISLLQNFSISDAAPRVQPAGGWFWPVTAIDVYVQPQPSYAREDAIKAMGQWNYSQAWFQEQYGLPSRPLFLLLLSNDTSSPVVVAFNQTTTGPYTNNDKTSFKVDPSGSVSAVSCSISVVMALQSGVATNDVFIENAIMDQLGNCLGLGRTQIGGDPMNSAAANKYDLNSPSTLDLYSLYQLSALNNVFAVNGSYSLPGWIPYAKSPQFPPPPSVENAPEFPGQWVALATLAFLLVVVTALGRQRPGDGHRKLGPATAQRSG